MEGEVLKDFGEQHDFKDFLMKRMGNQFHFILDNNDVYDIIQDREGNLWFACHHGGVSRYDAY